MPSVKVETLLQDPQNVRRHDVRNIEAIKASLSRFGQQKPILVGADNVVLAGNGTLAAAVELGWEKINVTKSSLTGSEARAYAIADNRTTDLSTFDESELADALEYISSGAEGIELADVGFTADEMEALSAGQGELGAGEGSLKEDYEDFGDQYGVVVICDSEADQIRVYEKLRSDGYKNLKVVVT
tara:strand:+ start:681 stop:1238 length:558 start_codon:yes stop_codon:yes gene_type:complete